MITELCMSGAMHRGIVQVGVLKALEEAGLIGTLKKVSGTSIGSILLFMKIIGFTADEMMDIILEMNTELLGDVSLKGPNSIFKGQGLRNWIIQNGLKKIDKFETMTTLEFYEKYGVRFITSVMCLETGIEYMDHESHPDAKLIDQLISTSSLPFVFPPCIIPDKSGARKTYLDGGMMDNFPMKLLNPGPCSFGVEIDIDREGYSYVHSESNTVHYIKRVLDIILNSEPRYTRPFRMPEHRVLTVCIGTLEQHGPAFKLSSDDKINLYKLGYNKMVNSDHYRTFNLEKHRILQKESLLLIKQEKDLDLETVE